MTDDLTFSEAVSRAGSGAMGAVTGYYPSAGHDTAPFSFLLPAFLRHRHAPPYAPNVFVYVDREHPRHPSTDRLSFRNHARGDVLVVETTQITALSVEGHPASLLTVAVHSDIPEEERICNVLRIRAENSDALGMCERAGWSPDVYIAPDDGCCMGGGNYDRCENSMTEEASPLLRFARPPAFWVTDHVRPTPDRRLRFAAEDRIPTPLDFPLELHKVALLSTRWGHSWPPLNGATLLRVSTKEVMSDGLDG